MKKKIYIFGNPLLDFDNLPIKLAPALQEKFPEIDFVIADPNENLKPVGGELMIIDTAQGIDKVLVIEDLEKIQTEKIYSLHDFDLAFNLKLLKKIGQLQKVKIFCVPMEDEEEKILGQLEKLLMDELVICHPERSGA
jgi:Ni,Fe-hydrogenase maturation factor